MELSLIWLNLIFNNNYSVIRDILNKISDRGKILDISVSEWKNLNVSEKIIEKISSYKLKQSAKDILNFCNKNDIKIVTIFDDNYPINLTNIQIPPTLLYYRGELSKKDELSISVVGSRDYTQYGNLATQKIVTDLAKNNITIVSGMARGIDTIAHTTALNNNTRTIAVLGCGVNVVYPSCNNNLYHKILENGAVISEFIPNTKPYAWNFPTRNRIISGLTLGTLVIEANIKSGTMVTANWASEQGKNVYAIPGNIFSDQSKGTNKLISEGAKIVSSSLDILEDLYEIIKIELGDTTSPKLEPNELLVFQNISTSPTSVYEIILKTGLPTGTINSILTILELNGYIKKLPGDTFIKDIKYF